MATLSSEQSIFTRLAFYVVSTLVDGVIVKQCLLYRLHSPNSRPAGTFLQESLYIHPALIFDPPTSSYQNRSRDVAFACQARRVQLGSCFTLESCTSVSWIKLRSYASYASRLTTHSPTAKA